MKTVTVRGVTLGGGRPCIILPVAGADLPALQAAARQAAFFKPELVEWRADGWGRAPTEAELAGCMTALRKILGETPVLFTWRTTAEGGETPLAAADYRTLALAAATAGADLVDVEAFSEGAGELTRALQNAGIKVVASNHDFAKTPPEAEILRRLQTMQDALGADIAKIAVMPQNTGDVLALLGATAAFAAEADSIPCITMSMGPLGSISRVSGEAFGSAATFGSAGVASAPGQLPADALRTLLDTLHTAQNG